MMASLITVDWIIKFLPNAKIHLCFSEIFALFVRLFPNAGNEASGPRRRFSSGRSGFPAPPPFWQSSRPLAGSRIRENGFHYPDLPIFSNCSKSKKTLSSCCLRNCISFLPDEKYFESPPPLLLLLFPSLFDFNLHSSESSGH